MTAFSDIFSHYIRIKSVKTQEMAKYCNIDRSNMYKLINGKRNPTSVEVVKTICEFMRLTIEEQNELIDAYNETIVGRTAYYRRKAIRDFLLSYSNDHTQNFTQITGNTYMMYDAEPDGMVATGELKRIINYIVSKEAQKADGKIQLIMQPECNQIMEILSMDGAENHSLTIEHIFCLNNAEDITQDKKYYNLMCFQKILIMYTNCECNYKPMVYYDNINSHMSCFNLMSSMVLTSEYALLCEANGEYGILIKDEKTLAVLRNVFRDLKACTMALAKCVRSLDELLSIFEGLDMRNGLISFQSEPCMMPFIASLLTDPYYMEDDLAEMKDVQERVFSYIKNLVQSIRLDGMSFIFNENGVRDFLKSGRSMEIPSQLYRPIKKKDQLALIHKVQKECVEGNYKLLRSNMDIAKSTIYMYITIHKGYLSIRNKRGELNFLCLMEPGLLNAFYDYFSTLKEESFYTGEEAEDLLNKLLIDYGVE